MSTKYLGARVTYTGHIKNTVQTSLHRTTEDNLRACYTALATLEGMTYERFLEDIKESASDIKVELYSSHGGAE